MLSIVAECARDRFSLILGYKGCPLLKSVLGIVFHLF